MRVVVVVLLLLFVANITARKRKHRNNPCYATCDLICVDGPSENGCKDCRKKCDASDETAMKSGELPSCKVMCNLFVCRKDNTDKCLECNKNCAEPDTTPVRNVTSQAPTKQTKFMRGKGGVGNKRMKESALFRRILDFLEKVLPIFGRNRRRGGNMMGPMKRNFRQPPRRGGQNTKPVKPKRKSPGGKMRNNRRNEWGFMRNNKPGGGYKGPGKNNQRRGKSKNGWSNGKNSGKWNKLKPKGKKKPPKKPKIGNNVMRVGNRSNISPAKGIWPIQSACANMCANKGACPRKVYFTQNQKRYSKECSTLLQEKCESSETMARCLLKEIQNTNGTCPRITQARRIRSKKCKACVESCEEATRKSTCLRDCIAPKKCVSNEEKTEMMGKKTKNCIVCLRKNCKKKKMDHTCLVSASAAQCAAHCSMPTDEEKMRSSMCTICRTECDKPGEGDESIEMPPTVPSSP